jgi:cell wall-associated NlpC family hydrolase
MERITAQEVRLAAQAAQLRARITTETVRLITTRRRQATLITLIVRQQRAIETQVTLRQQLLRSVQHEIAELERQEQARQLRMRRQLQRSLTSTQTLTSGERAVSIAIHYLGTPYTWGSANPDHGLDCSGLTVVVFAQLGIELPHYAAAQYHYGNPVPRDQLRPGDLVFFRNLEHMGVYVGQGDFIHAPHTGDVIK